MLESIGEGMWRVDGMAEGPSVCVSFGAHGNERPPIEAGRRLVEALERGERQLACGRLLLVHANPRATDVSQRWSPGGVDLNRCFHRDTLSRAPELYEEGRAREIAAALEEVEARTLVDFHCTVEPGRPFLMHHPAPRDAAHREVGELLAGGVVLADPSLIFGGVSLDEWMSTRDGVGICYETGWVGDPANTPEAVLLEMENLLVGLGVFDGPPARRHPGKQLLELERAVRCEEEGFSWRDGVGENLQSIAAGTELGAYTSGRAVALAADATLIFPKKRPELVRIGQPLVYLARTVSG